MASDPKIDATRRRLLARLGLAAGAAYAAPALTLMGRARASGASGGGSGASAASGPAGGGSSSSRPSAPARRRQASQPPRQPARQPARRQTVRQAPPPEIVLFLPAGAIVAPAELAGYRVIAASDAPGLSGQLFRLGLPTGRSVDQARNELGQLFPTGLADENHLYRPDDFLCEAGDCDAHAMIGWAGWPSAFAPRIGMIDTGINQDHDALRGQRLTVHQPDLPERDAASRQHGTAIAAMLLGRLDSRVPGLLPHAELVAVEAFHRDASGDAADAFSLAGAIDLLMTAEVSVINLSFSGPQNAVLEQVTRRAAERGIGLVAAAGNGGAGATPAFPAAWEHVIAVTAVGQDGRAYRQANQGAYIRFAAPGVNVWTAASISGGRLRSGTSYAAPFVTATLAVQRMRSPGLPIGLVVDQLIGCAQDLGEAGRDPVFGHGLISSPRQCVAGDAQVFSVSGE